ncbi:transport permease protein [Sphaerisporangium melleum]|uniref:Transport permease protein n=1 Tax=Sphaerisporangium melleum TaxID=321316 RepID=A0A917VRY8_9ACTN|nr:ABC transporter permease [Sphaerisporangium melleum]GGL11933.1 transport permease protein [Sphaerisporangium melleum]GII74364.1 transport permease protein [Sphaerisporangium melleum]
MTTTLPVQPAKTATPAPAARMPSAFRLALARGRLELKSFFRTKGQFIVIFSLPAIMLILLGSMAGRTPGVPGVTGAQLMTAGMIGAGIMSTSFQNLGINIALERDDGTLKRLYGMPTPRIAYFGGKIIQVLVCMVAEVAILVTVGVLLFDVQLPGTLDRWVTFAWVLALGGVACTLLGIVASSLPKSSRGANAIITLPFLVLQFCSGVYFPFSNVPVLIQHVAALFPLKWITQGMRSVFLPEQAAAAEPAGAWEHPMIALVLAAWCVGGVLLAMKTFRWSRDA